MQNITCPFLTVHSWILRRIITPIVGAKNQFAFEDQYVNKSYNYQRVALTMSMLDFLSCEICICIYCIGYSSSTNLNVHCNFYLPPGHRLLLVRLLLPPATQSITTIRHIFNLSNLFTISNN